MEKDEVFTILNNLIDNLKQSITNLCENRQEIEEEIKKWNCQITINELKESLETVLDKVKNWESIYSKTKDILQIDLKEYDFVSKECSYILGECALIDSLNAEVIDWQIGLIGSEMENKIKEEKKQYGN